MKTTLKLSLIMVLFSLSATLKGQIFYQINLMEEIEIPRAYSVPTLGFNKLELENKSIFKEKKYDSRWINNMFFTRDTSTSVVHSQRLFYDNKDVWASRSDKYLFLNNQGKPDSLFTSDLTPGSVPITLSTHSFKFSYTNDKVTEVNDSLFFIINEDSITSIHTASFFYDPGTGNRIHDEDYYSYGTYITLYMYDASNRLIKQYNIEDDDTTGVWELKYKNGLLTSVSASEINSSNETILGQIDSLTYDTNNLVTSHLQWSSVDRFGNLDLLTRERYHYTNAHLDQIINETWDWQFSKWLLTERTEISYENGIAKKGYTFNRATGGDTLYRYTFNEPYTGIKEASSTPLFSLYPNPAENVLHIQSEKAQDMTISILAADGTEVLSKESKTLSNNNHVDVSSLKAGLYFVRIVSDEGVYTQKLLLNK